MDKKDLWVWKDKESVVFTVKSAYKILKEDFQGAERELLRGFWRLKAHSSSHLTAWRVLEDKIVTKKEFGQKGDRYEFNYVLFVRGGRGNHVSSFLHW